MSRPMKLHQRYITMVSSCPSPAARNRLEWTHTILPVRSALQPPHCDRLTESSNGGCPDDITHVNPRHHSRGPCKTRRGTPICGTIAEHSYPPSALGWARTRRPVRAVENDSTPNCTGRLNG